MLNQPVLQLQLKQLYELLQTTSTIVSYQTLTTQFDWEITILERNVYTGPFNYCRNVILTFTDVLFLY